MTQPTRYRPSIDGLRALAIASVVANHVDPLRFRSGFLGVDIFFVISGFLITGILMRAWSDPGTRFFPVLLEFYSKRVRRIFPALLVMLGLVIGLGYYFDLPADFAALGMSGLAAAGFCLNLLLARTTDYFAADASSNPLLHTWSLGVEEQFYLVWPLLLFLLMRRRRTVVTVLFCIATASFSWLVMRTSLVATAAYYLPQYRLWELSLGAILASEEDFVRWAMERLVWMGPAVGCLGSALLVAGFIAVREPGGALLLPVAGTFLLMAAGEDYILNRFLLSNRVAVSVGLISYPLYLFHWPLLSFCRSMQLGGDSAASRWIVVLASAALASITYWVIERPVRRSRPLGKPALWLCAMLVVVAAACGGIYKSGGLPKRYPSELVAILEHNYDTPKDWRAESYFIVGGRINFKGFPRDPAEIDVRKPTIVLWGDSHAAALYPGVLARYGGDHNIVQRTVGGLGPFLDNKSEADPDLPDPARAILEDIRLIRPQWVILHSNWTSEGWRALDETIRQLKAMGTGHIAVVGPVPIWRDSLQSQLFKEMRREHSRSVLPSTLSSGYLHEFEAVDDEMRAGCASWRVTYISPREIFKSGNGYLARLGEGPDELVALDYGHLTVAGSKYLVAHFGPLD